MNDIRQVGRAVTRSLLEQEIEGSNLGPIKSNAVLLTARHHYNISSKGLVTCRRNDAEMGPRKPVTRFSVEIQRV